MDGFLIGLEGFLQSLTAGLLVGALYGLMCVGLGLIFGVMKVVNFAQGDFLMAGMYAALLLLGVTGASVGSGLAATAAPYAMAILAGPVVFGGGYLLHRFLLARVSGSRAPAGGTGAGGSGAGDDGHGSQLILTLGVSLILQNGALILFGADVRSIRSPLSAGAWVVGPLLGEDLTIFVNQARGVGFVIAVAVAAALFAVMTRSTVGKTLKAAADNPEAAVYMGIDVDRAHRLAFAAGVGITAVAGALLAIVQPFQPYIGLEFVIIMYAGVVLGGLGSVSGAFWGGMCIGVVQQMSAFVLPVQLQNAMIFVVFLAILMFRPQGFFGRNAERT